MRKNTKRICYIVLVFCIILLGLYYTIHVIEGLEQNIQAKGLIVNPIGGLGNQLFIYAGGLTISKRFGIPLFILPIDKDTENKNVHSNTDYRYLFNEAIPVESNDERVKSAKQVSFKSEIIYGLYNLNELPVGEAVYIHVPYHYYQNYSFIKDVIPEIRDSLVEQLNHTYGESMIDNKSSAFVHIRRGDYITSGGGYRLLDIEYYKKGIKYLNTSSELRNIYIFSDDIAWCKAQSWNTTNKLVFVDEPDELKVLYMMSQCWAGAVISNSTFSCWGAFLGAYERAETIVYPSKAFMSSLPDSWIKI